MSKDSNKKQMCNDKISLIAVDLRKLRRDKDVTQQDISDYLGITQSSYQSYESGKANPSPENLSKLAEFFGVTRDYLLGREDGLPPGAEDITNEALGLPQIFTKMCRVELEGMLAQAGGDIAKLRKIRDRLREMEKELFL